MKPIYMDHHATTPLDPRVLEVMLPYLHEQFGNPSSSTHIYGEIAKKAVEQARGQVAQLLNAQNPDEIIFTSCATESNNMVLKGSVALSKVENPEIITIATEHKAILDTLKRLNRQGVVSRLAKIDKYGIVDLNSIRELINDRTILITIQAANSEIGTLQPLRSIGQIAEEHNIPFHTDAVQALGKVKVDVEKDHIDFLSISAHKMYGPKGVGALYMRKGHRIAPLLDGGGQERGVRSGTLNVPGIAGLGKAAEIADGDLGGEADRLRELRDMLISGAIERIEHTTLNGHPTLRLPNNANLSFSYIEGESLVLACKAFAVSTGSACSSETLKSSSVLEAIGVPDSLAHSSIRFGLGKSNTKEDITLLLDTLEKNVRRLRDMSPLYEMAQQGIDIDKFEWGEHKH